MPNQPMVLYNDELSARCDSLDKSEAERTAVAAKMENILMPNTANQPLGDKSISHL